jgi:hypothetical protein
VIRQDRARSPGRWSAGTASRLTRGLLAGVVLVLAVLAVPAPASADGLDDLCTTVPAPVRPDYQVAGMVMDKPGRWSAGQPGANRAPGPDLSSVPDIAPDPFADPSVPIADVYGWAWRFTNYDLGCGNDYIRDPSAVVSTNGANVVMAGMASMTSTIASLENMAHAPAFGWLKPVVATIGGHLQGRVLTLWLPLALLLLSVVLGVSAVRASYAESFRRLQIVLVCVGLAVVSLVFPAKAADLMDTAGTTVAEAAQAGFQTRASDVITRQSIYPTWLVGNFGSADSSTAVEYGPRLMSALTYSWSDVKRMQADPAAQTAIDKAKGAEYKKIATEVKQKDPAAYQSLTGKTDTRTAPSILGQAFVLIMGFFVALASLITVLARLVMLALVIGAMVGSVVGVVHFATLQRLWDLFTAALLNTAKFTIAAGVMTFVLGAIATAPVGMGWRLLIAVVVTVIAVMLTKPIASFKAMTGMDPSRSIVAGVLRRAAGTAVGTAVGHRVATADPAPGSPPDPAGEGVSQRSPWSQPVEPAMPPLPPPPSLKALPVVTAQQVAARSGWVGAETYGQTGRPRPALEPATVPAPAWPTPVPSNRPATLPLRPVTAGGPVVHPTGILLQPGHGLYRPGQGSARNEEETYLRFPEPQIDANGEQTTAPVYHVRVGG